MGTAIHLFLFILLRFLCLSSADTYNVNISTEHVNLVDSRFLSFTIDPKYLFSSSEKYSSKECICMASSLTPAYLRIAGPSTAHMTFHNATISINDVNFPDQNFDITAIDSDAARKVPLDYYTRDLAVSHRQWKKFVHWAKSTGFDLVFALNNEERTASGMWDPNTALNILTVAEKVKVRDMFWELGYECTNQSTEEYLNDLKTLRVIIDTFPPGRTAEWKVVGGDVTKCLQAESKNDFKDYMTLSNDMMDALLLNGNSSSHELERMSEHGRLKLLRLLSRSQTPLWLTETNQKRYNDLERAADWLVSLGYSAKNGFAVHYRELEEEDMYVPTLSFYMAFLFKNLVGERVLNVEMYPEQAILFAHCTSLRHKPVPGAVTLFGANMDEEPVRFSVKLSRREKGGEIMQFILGKDHNGNIVVNGRPMYYEGDLKLVVKRVRPYDTLPISLPAKSFGFWVIANTKIDACHNVDKENKTFIEAETVSNDNFRAKRSINDDFDDYTQYTQMADLSYDFEDTDVVVPDNHGLRSRISDMNKDLDKIRNAFKRNLGNNRFKRKDTDIFGKSKLQKQGYRHRTDRGYQFKDRDFYPRRIIDDLLEKARQRVNDLKSLRPSLPKRNLKRVSKRQSKNSKLRPFNSLKAGSQIIGSINRKPKHIEKISIENDDFLKKVNRNSKTDKDISKRTSDTQDKSTKRNQDTNKLFAEAPNALEALVRKRRSISNDIEQISTDDITDLSGKNKAKLWQMLKKLNKEFGDFSGDRVDSDSDSAEGIVLQTELSDDSATIRVEDSNHGMIETTMKTMLNVLEDLNKNLNRVWNAINLLD